MQPTDVEEVAGIPLDEQLTQYEPKLVGLEADSVVTIFNPLSIKFRAKFARTITAPPNETEADRQKRLRMQQFGVDTQKQGGTVAHVSDYLTFNPGETKRLPGHIAQVVVRQMVNEILQRRNMRNKLADSFARHEVEDEIVLSVSGSMDFMNMPNAQQELHDEVSKLNPEVGNEQPFPTEHRVDVAGDAQGASSGGGTQGPSRKRGRPARIS